MVIFLHVKSFYCLLPSIVTYLAPRHNSTHGLVILVTLASLSSVCRSFQPAWERGILIKCSFPPKPCYSIISPLIKQKKKKVEMKSWLEGSRQNSQMKVFHYSLSNTVALPFLFIASVYVHVCARPCTCVCTRMYVHALYSTRSSPSQQSFISNHVHFSVALRNPSSRGLPPDAS